MTKFEELINKHCPNGFKITPLWSVTIWDKKFNNVNKNKQDKTIKYNHILADELKQFQNEKYPPNFSPPPVNGVLAR